MRRALLWVVWGLGACSSNESAPSTDKCTPGHSVSCACTDGRSGAQQCQSDGTFAACVCDGSGGGGGNAGQSSGGNAGQTTGGAGGIAGDSLTGEWSKVFPGYFEIAALDVDDSGTLVVAGTSTGPVDFGNGPVGGDTSGWNRLLIIAGFDASGQRKFAFAKDAGRMYSPSLAIRTTSQNRIIVSGLSTVTSKGSGPSTTYTQVWPCGTAPASIGDGVQFVVELDQSGNCIWDHTYPAPGYSQYPTSVAAASNDSAYVTGTQQYSTLPTRRYLADGAPGWEKPFGGSALGALTNTSVVIASYDSMELPTGTVSGLFALAKLDPTGGVLAGTAWGTPAYDPARQLVGFDVGAGDRIAIALRYTGTVDLGGGPVTSTDGGTSQSKLFALLDQGFAHLFSRSIDEPKSDSGETDDWESRTVVTGSKAVYTGAFWRTVDFGTGALQAVGTTDTDFDIFVASYSFDGTPLVSRRFGGDGTDAVRAVTADTSGAVYLAGYFSASVDFGDGSHDNLPQDSGVQVTPTYLVKLRP